VFSVSLVNDPFGDPAVFLEFKHRRRAILFDLGDLHPLPARKILKVDYVFVSHTHMDHFIGFDHLVRLCLGRDRRISLFGPPGFIDQVQRRLGAYSWNLVLHYTNDFVFTVTETDPGRGRRRALFQCRTGFVREDEGGWEADDDVLVDEGLFLVRRAFLDHKIPSLAFSFEERQHVNIKKNVLREMGFDTGPWLNEVKEGIVKGYPPETPILARWRDEGGVKGREVTLGEIRRQAVKVTPGRRVAYVTDALYSPDNVERITALAGGAEILFIETVFLHEDRRRAAETYHLTARQAGEIARLCGAKRMVPFHFSPKYKGSEDLLVREALAAFAG